jgi:hypothetical protein
MCCGACCGKRHHARAAFENGAKEIESRFTRNGKTAELLNPRLPALQKQADECDAVCRIAVGIAAFCQKY